MGDKCDRITLYTAQAGPVLAAIEQDGRCFSKREYVERKYEESAGIFLTAYDWFVSEAKKRVPRPEGAQFPYWAFHDLYSLDGSSGCRPMTLQVPLDEAVFFDVYDWNKILCLKYLGDSEEEERDFVRKLEAQGIRETDVMLTPFYPVLKREILSSWSRLFRYHEGIASGEIELEKKTETKNRPKSIQAALWQIKKEWIC